MNNKFLDNLLSFANKFASAKVVLAIKDGIIITMPLTIVGSIFLLVGNLPFPGYGEFMSNLFGDTWDLGLNQVVGSTFGLVALVAVFGIAYTYARNEGYDGVPAGLLAIVSFVIMNDHFTMLEGQMISGVIPTEFLGGKGMIGSIILGLTVGYVYSLCLKKNLRITLPDGVPTGVAAAFTSMIPYAVVMSVMSALVLLLEVVFTQNFFNIVYTILQTPLQGLSSTLIGAILIPIFISLLWWSGIHGSALISGIISPLLMANAIANQELIDSGAKLVAGDNAFIVTAQFLDQYITVTGSGFTLGLVLLMLFKAKSDQFKQLSRLSIIPGFFNINEPILFGTPIVFNPYMFIPFILAPLTSAMITYFAISVGLVGPFGSVLVPWTTPILVSGLLVGGIRGAVLQLVCLMVTTLIYLPFFRIADKQAYEMESKN